MTRDRVYIETSIPSFYHEVRTEPEMVARRQWTRDWWQTCAEAYELVTSLPVLEELERGDHPRRDDTLALLSHLPLLPIEDPIAEIVDTYVARHVMPRDPRGDALHLALAFYHRCQFLLTWNCQHLANANKREHIRHVNTLLGLPVPMVTTPMELLQLPEDSQ